MIKAFITNKKSPSDRMVAGNVSNINIGFISESNMANTMATRMEVPKLSIFTPGNISANKKAFTAITSIRIINFTK
jgi:hypothetical protein